MQHISRNSLGINVINLAKKKHENLTIGFVFVSFQAIFLNENDVK
jgi:hypothetical protein